LKLVHFEIFDQFNHLFLKIREFSHFNQKKLLGLFDCFVNILKLYCDCLNCLTHFCFNIKLNTIIKRA